MGTICWSCAPVDQSAVPAVLDAAEALGLQAQSLGAVLEIANRVLALMQALLGSVGGSGVAGGDLGRREYDDDGDLRAYARDWSAQSFGRRAIRKCAACSPRTPCC